MNFDQFNEKSKLIINEAQNKAILLSHQQITVDHLAFSILIENDSYLNEILSLCNSDKSSILSEIETRLQKLPNVSGKNYPELTGII